MRIKLLKRSRIGELTPLKLALIYAFFGILWILFSDILLGQISFSAEFFTRLSIIKGWLFVFVTTLLIYWLVLRYEAGRKSAEKALIISEDHLTELNKCLLSFGVDPVKNINRLVSLCGEQLGATCALYNRLEDGLLCALGKWNTPPELASADMPEGHICYDVIRDSSSDVKVIRNLEDTIYASTDPSVRKFGLKTYVGKAVSFGGLHIGSLCVVYQSDHILTEGESEFLQIVASAVGIEEMRREAAKDIRNNEKQFRELSQQFNAILDIIPDIVLLLSPDLKIVWVNKEPAAFGTSAERVIGSHCFDLWQHSNIPCDPGPVRKSLETGKPAGETVSTRDGKVWDVRTIPLKDNEGRIISIVQLNRDITEHRKLEEQLRQIQKMEAVGQIAGGVAHDFNNMLSALLGFCTLAQMKMKPDDPAMHYLEEISKLVDRGANLTKSLLAFSRKQVLTMKPVSINFIVNSIGKLLSRVIGEDIQLSVVVPDKDIIIMADSSQLDQILLNLATNARDAMPKGGALFISVSEMQMNDAYKKEHGYGEPGVYAVITVQDTGTGIAEKAREKLFEPFFTTKAVGKGTGLGLAIVYGIVKQHNGFISVFSKPGKGSTFKVLLPAINIRADISCESARTPISGGSATILLAEDDPSVRSGIRTLLMELGYSIIEASDGRQAAELFRDNSSRIHLVLMDMIMPLMNGQEAYSEMRKIRADAKALFMSGYTVDYMIAKVGMEGGMNFISKPIDPRELMMKIREILG